MSKLLADFRLVFVGPAEGQTAVGDYSEHFVGAVRPYFGDVVEVRTAGPGGDGVRDIARYRKTVADAARDAPGGRVLVHAELAAGGVGPFWSIVGHKTLPVTATVHDPPQGTWWPARTRFVAEHRVLMHALHYPLRPVLRALEGAVNGRRTLFALSEIGSRSITITYPRTNVVYVPHLVKKRRDVLPAEDRQKAVGFFGHVYRGKGFEQIERIRRALPDDILIRVAGRGTENLKPSAGVEIVGPVDGPDEDAFFESVRAIVIPYNKRHWYAETYPASGAVAHATSYRTPVVCTAYGALTELGESTGAVVVRTDTDATPAEVAGELTAAIVALVNDEARLREIGANAEKCRHARSPERIAESFAAAWQDLLSGPTPGGR
ncbi:Glycosyltransferase involved in cell wall bisynthesis [Mycolicibacterium rutilum]|uniref:Glycosyltransferase involved in cell wall bisynthesis n=1 Tax=Mycolicibacterium rutilum TaxID=370526 RepID=A0A1H6LQV6_MYCRU|nr:glycosyltransferase [Mycolicibacterium rutilum]SEH91067.1 Glycosyltransferase involved in cell wall bisynthesis [Mycolicibacterium rutilum]